MPRPSPGDAGKEPRSNVGQDGDDLSPPAASDRADRQSVCAGGGRSDWSPAREPGFCATCGTTSLSDFNECGSGDCWWVNLIREEPKRAA